jgi:hypothetical protein
MSRNDVNVRWSEPRGVLVVVMNKIALCEDSGAAVRRHWTMQKKLGVLFGLGIPGASKIGQKVALTH